MKDIKWGIVVAVFSAFYLAGKEVRLATNFSSPMSLAVTTTISYLLLFLLLLCREI
jgi:hypothetical protein